jgi:hypothetical protein
MVRMMDTYLKGIGYHLAFDEWIKRNYEVRTYHRDDWDTTQDAPRGFEASFYNNGDSDVVRIVQTMNTLHTYTNKIIPIEDVASAIGFLQDVTRREREATV